MNATLLQEVDTLSLEDKLALLDRVWDSVAAQAEKLPVPGSHITELERRERRIADGEATFDDYEAARERIFAKVGQ